MVYICSKNITEKMIKLGNQVKQPDNYTAFVPDRFPPEELLHFTPDLLSKAALAERLIGKLDGVSQTLPDTDFFLSMYVIKDATHSAQIEGTRATMIDALELSAGLNTKITDADDILFYIKALNYGMERLKNFPFSLRLIRELHNQLMSGARSTHFADPGEFRKSQNWIGGSSPTDALFVPPPVPELNRALHDLEIFIHNESIIPVLQAGILHAQFETIHPFLDGNGRTGRLIITLFLYHRAILEKPVLFLSSYFKKHRQLYYDKLNAYHHNNPMEWLHFFLNGIIETAEASIQTSKKITVLYNEDMGKIQSLGKREAQSGVKFLRLLFKNPITSASNTASLMQFTRSGAAKLIDRFIEIGILIPLDESTQYGKTYFYKNYLNLFNEK